MKLVTSHFVIVRIGIVFFVLCSNSGVAQVDPLTANKLRNMFAKDTVVRSHWINYFYVWDSPLCNFKDDDTRPVQPPLTLDGVTMYPVRQIRKGQSGQPDYYSFGFAFLRGDNRGTGFSVAGNAKSQPSLKVLHDHFVKIGFESINRSHAYADKVNYYGEGPTYLLMEGNSITELRRLTKEELRIERNHLFARYGYKFKSEDLQLYYSMMDWYKPLHDNVEKMLTQDDKDLIAYIQALEKAKEK